MLRIAHPPGYAPERQYVYRVLLAEFLGLEYQTEEQERSAVSITCRDDPSDKELIVADSLFQTPEYEWLTPASLPRRPLATTNNEVDATGVSETLPVVYGQTPYFDIADRQITLGLDVFGSAFFMLTRYEEVVDPSRDMYGRFPLTAALAHQEGFLDRPIVDEYVEVLWACISRLWPSLRRTTRRRQVTLSHDVDWPLVTAGRTVPQLVKSAAGDVVKRRDPVLAAHRLRSWLRVRRGDVDGDIGNNFDWIMTQSERVGLTSAFFFIPERTDEAIDGPYLLEDPWIRRLLRHINDRGHEIGLHPGFQTFQDPARTRLAFDRLRRVCAEEGIAQPAWGGRQHFLRWENPTTWQNWEDAGLQYDSTLSFAEEVGFRCGVCHPYPVFNLRTRQPLKLVERPLIVMEATLLGDIPESRMSLRRDEVVAYVDTLNKRCASFQGDFTLLWHNSSLISPRYRSLYRDILSVLAS